jgi:hypothetical protein
LVLVLDSIFDFGLGFGFGLVFAIACFGFGLFGLDFPELGFWL